MLPSDFYRDLPETISLSDGGVRDNTGLTAIVVGHEPAGYEDDYYLIGSDAGAIVNVLQDPPGGIARLWPPTWLRGIPRGRVRKVHYLRRQFDVMGHHNNRITVALGLQIHRTRPTSSKGMAMLRLDELIEARHEPVDDVSAVVRVPTRLKYPGWNTANLLSDHGANLLWARLSEYTDLADHQPLEGITKQTQKDLDPRDEALDFLGRVIGAMQTTEQGAVFHQALTHTVMEAGEPLSARAAKTLSQIGVGISGAHES